MKIGIISDTHNNIEMAEKAIKIFVSKKADMIVHAGDLTSPKMLELFKNQKCRFVLGNGDIDVEFINKKSQELGFGEVNPFCEMDIDGKKIFVFHGNDVALFRNVVASGKYNYIIKGHTHSFENYVLNNTRVINPGTLFGKDEHTIAILDTKTDRVEMIRIAED